MKRWMIIICMVSIAFILSAQIQGGSPPTADKIPDVVVGDAQGGWGAPPPPPPPAFGEGEDWSQLRSEGGKPKADGKDEAGDERPRRGMRGHGPMMMREPSPEMVYKIWKMSDSRLQKLATDYSQIETQRLGLVDELVKAKKQYEPGKMDPASVLARQKLDGLLGQLHELGAQEREVTGEACRIMGPSFMRREHWSKILQDELDAGRITQAPLRERAKLWLQAAGKADQGGMAGFASALVGDELGQKLAQMIHDFIKDEFEDDQDGPPPGGPLPELGPVEQQDLMGRLSRLEKSQRDLQMSLDHQRREIKRLRQRLEKYGLGQSKDQDKDGKAIPGEAPSSALPQIEPANE